MANRLFVISSIRDLTKKRKRLFAMAVMLLLSRSISWRSLSREQVEAMLGLTREETRIYPLSQVAGALLK